MSAAISTRSLIAALGLLALATSASAECAWVLWTTVYRISGNAVLELTPQPLQGYMSKAACEEAVDRRESNEETSRKKDPSRERYFVCLPDTVDPRGPKGTK